MCVENFVSLLLVWLLRDSAKTSMLVANSIPFTWSLLSVHRFGSVANSDSGGDDTAHSQRYINVYSQPIYNVYLCRTYGMPCDHLSLSIFFVCLVSVNKIRVFSCCTVLYSLCCWALNENCVVEINSFHNFTCVWKRTMYDIRMFVVVMKLNKH